MTLGKERDAKDTGPSTNGTVANGSATDKKTGSLKMNIFKGKKAVKEPEVNGNTATEMGASSHGISPHHRTSYMETIMHLLKGNVGTGIFAMGDAFKNSGILTGTILTVILGVFCTYSAHILVNCAKHIQQKLGLEEAPDYAETVEACFENGPPKLQKWSKTMKSVVNLFLIVTQLGFCCVYMVFIASNIQEFADRFEFKQTVQMWMLILLIPVLLPCLITNLKYLVPCSTIANISMLFGLGVTMYYSCQDLPSVTERKMFSSFEQLPLFFGTTIFAFEGICLVLPLKNQMKKPKLFDNIYGVLNMGMLVVIFGYTGIGFIGYLKYGEDVKGSLSLNLPQDVIWTQVTQIAVAIGILFTYTLQFFIAIQVLWPITRDRFGLEKEKFYHEILFRALIVLLTFVIAEIVPNLGIFISLVGSVSSTALALIFPPVSEFVIAYSTDQKGPSVKTLILNSIILILSLFGFATGTYEALRGLYNEFFNKV